MQAEVNMGHSKHDGSAQQAVLKAERSQRTGDPATQTLVALLCLDLGVVSRAFFDYADMMELRERMSQLVTTFVSEGHVIRRYRLKPETVPHLERLVARKKAQQEKEKQQ